MEECKVTEIDRLKIAKCVHSSWLKRPNTDNVVFSQWLDREIANLDDPFAQAKHKLHGWSKSETTTPGTWNLIHYVEHLKNERDHYKIQYEHAKEAAAEPLNPKRVLATAEKILKSRGESFAAECVDVAIRQTVGVKSKPYEVQE
jgi:hypothetical protein